MRIILAGALGIVLTGVAGASATPMNASAIDEALGANSPMIKVFAGLHHFAHWPSCEHLNSYDPKTRTFVSHGRRHPCAPGH
jgi:hypothetical protein